MQFLDTLQYVFFKTKGTASVCAIVNVLSSSEVDRRFESRGVKRTIYKIGIYNFSTKYEALKSKNKNWLGRNREMYPSGGTCLSPDSSFRELTIK